MYYLFRWDEAIRAYVYCDKTTDWREAEFWNLLRNHEVIGW